MKKLLIILFFLVSLTAKAQYFQTGQDPSSIKWRQINTGNFQLIYPDYYEDQAQELAFKLESVYDYASYSLNYKPRKISVILHTQTVQSNGLVAYAPRRSEFYTTPHQGIYPLDWLEQLAVHEYRHVVQIDKIHDELPRIINILLGEQGTALIFGAYLPWWFIEGDAVVTETALSQYGRGRFPSFLMEHRAQLVERGKYSYDKAYLGSYKNYVPNHYQLGYYLVGNSRERYGAGLWEKVLTRVGEKPLSLVPFNKALKNEVGMTKVELYKSVFDSLNNVWKAEDSGFVRSGYSIVSQPSKTYTNYMYNHWLNDSTIISYKTSLNRIPAFVKLDKNGNEMLLHQPGIIFDESVNYSEEWIVWSEQVSDLRWTHSGHSVIWMLNAITGKKQSLKTEYKAFAPALSADHNKILVVEVDFSNHYYLSVYNAVSGKLISRVQTPDNNYFFSPQWLNEKEAVAALLTKNGKRLVQVDLATGQPTLLFDQDLGEIKQLSLSGNLLYFISGYSGTDAMYRLDLETKDLNGVYEPRFGVAYPALNSAGKLVLSDYSASGYRLIQPTTLDPVDISEIKKENYPMAGVLASQEKGLPDFDLTNAPRYPSQTYKKAAHLFHFHSWAPVFVDPYNYDFEPGVSLASQNYLGTAETVLGYKWLTSEKTGLFYGHYIYKGWYPVLDFKVNAGKRSSEYSLITENIQNGQVVSRDTTQKRFTWKETSLAASAKLPLNLTRGKYYRMLQPEISFKHTMYKTDSSTPEGFHAGKYQSLSYRLYFHQLMRRSYQDIQSNFGIVADGSYIHSPSGSEDMGHVIGGKMILYLPGILANHGISIYTGAQNRKNGDYYSFSDIIRFPRGWMRAGSKEMTVVSADYKFPLLNPDLSIGGLTYVKRINTSLFYDYASMIRNIYENGKINGTYAQNISSMGIELTGDMHFLRFYAPVQIGCRLSYLPEISNVNLDFLISIDFTSL